MAGYSCLAIDLRGHGESNMSGALNYRSFSDADHLASLLDVEAAFDWMSTKGADASNTVAIGASIGANLAINFVVSSGLPCAVALSPGLDYHGVTTEPSMHAMRPGQRMILIASDDDPESLASIQTLHAAKPTQTLLLETHGLGHGTWMFEKDPALIRTVISAISPLS